MPGQMLTNSLITSQLFQASKALDPSGLDTEARHQLAIPQNVDVPLSPENQVFCLLQ
jgi:hypothetical protein